MRVIGINLNHTGFGGEAMDGGVCLLVDGKPVVAVSEERISRQRYDAGFALSLDYCLNAEKLSISDIDAFAVCANNLDLAAATDLLKLNGFNIPKEKIILSPTNNLTHAYAAYYMSSFNGALVITLAYDGVAAYIVKNNTFTDITSNHKIPHLGEMYKNLTKAIGYASYQDAGKTMALASYGCDDGIKIGEIYPSNNMDIYAPTNNQKALAHKAQQDLETVSLKLCTDLLAEYKINNLCLAGGIGLNCVNNYNLISKLPKNTNIMIQPASGASGLCLGAAFYGYYLQKPKVKNTYKISNVYWGTNYTQSDVKQALEKIKNYSTETFTIIPFSADKIAELLIHDKVVAIFMGKSEFGPRALGHRSLIAAPYSSNAKEKIDTIKQREYYRPYAPSVLAEFAAEYFTEVPNNLSDFMLVTSAVKFELKNKIPYVVHIDGTSRIQTVRRETEPVYYKLIDAFRKRSGIPMVLNTSFNRKSEPIVETPMDAVNTFLCTPIDALLLGNILVIKNGISI